MPTVIMPKMGDAMEEGKIVQWLKNAGETVKSGEPIAEIETDKSNVEIDADADGVLTISIAAGETVAVGSVIGAIGDGAASASSPSAPAPQQQQAAPQTAPPPTPVTQPQATAPDAKNNGSGSAPSPVTMPVQAPQSAPAPPVAATAVPSPGVAAAAPSTPFKPYESFIGALPENLGGTASLIGEPLLPGGGDGSGSADRVRATPVARAMAQAHSLDLAALRGSGPDGGITKRDVEEAIARGGAPAAAAPSTGTAAQPVAAPSAPAAVTEGDEVQEFNAMRRTIARRLAESKSTIPHFYVTSEIDVEAMLALREQVNASAQEGQGKISLNDFLVKAVAVALSAHPVVNSVFSDNTRILRKSVNIGVAVSLENGLIVPVVKGCESKSIRAISRETHPLIEKARSGKLAPEEYTGGTFTISNLGQYDVENFAAIINPGEAGILAVSSIRQVAAVVDGQVTPRKRMKVTLCADHRVMDGVEGAEFLQTLKRVIENPLQILA